MANSSTKRHLRASSSCFVVGDGWMVGLGWASFAQRWRGAISTSYYLTDAFKILLVCAVSSYKESTPNHLLKRPGRMGDIFSACVRISFNSGSNHHAQGRYVPNRLHHHHCN